MFPASQHDQDKFINSLMLLVSCEYIFFSSMSSIFTQISKLKTADDSYINVNSTVHNDSKIRMR